MPYIELEDHLPGITGLLEYRKDSAAPIRELTQELLRGSSTLTEGERELIATAVSHGNECRFCTSAHSAVTNRLLNDANISRQVRENLPDAPVSEKMRALLVIARETGKSGRNVTTGMIKTAREAGATDTEIHDTVLIASLFCLYNRYVDGLATVTPEDPGFYEKLADRLVSNGYRRLPQGYDHLKKQSGS